MAGPDRGQVVRSWPLLVLAVPAAVAVWSGWVGIGRLTGFGVVRPLPGIWDSLRLDTAVTLPVRVEAYAAYALRAWLSARPVVSAGTRRFARWSAVGSLVLGMAGQVAWHLLSQAHVARAPWEVTTGVSCLPVLVLGMAAGLAHLLRADASAARESKACGPDQEMDQAGRSGLVVGDDRLAQAREAAARVRAAGQRVSRRSLRAAGCAGRARSWARSRSSSAPRPAAAAGRAPAARRAAGSSRCRAGYLGPGPAAGSETVPAAVLRVIQHGGGPWGSHPGVTHRTASHLGPLPLTAAADARGLRVVTRRKALRSLSIAFLLYWGIFIRITAGQWVSMIARTLAGLLIG